MAHMCAADDVDFDRGIWILPWMGTWSGSGWDGTSEGRWSGAREDNAKNAKAKCIEMGQNKTRMQCIL